jgi:hypothetical protein
MASDVVTEAPKLSSAEIARANPGPDYDREIAELRASFCAAIRKLAELVREARQSSKAGLHRVQVDFAPECAGFVMTLPPQLGGVEIFTRLDIERAPASFSVTAYDHKPIARVDVKDAPSAARGFERLFNGSGEKATVQETSNAQNQAPQAT